MKGNKAISYLGVLAVPLFMGALVACSDDGKDGKSCTVEQNEDGTATLSCNDGTSVTIANGTDGTAGTAGTAGTNGVDGTDGIDGDGCTAVDNTDGTYTITCGTDTVVVGDGTSCSVTENTDGSSTIDCEDGSTATIKSYALYPRTMVDLEVAITSVSNSGDALAVSFSLMDNDNPVTNLTMGPVRIMVNQYASPVETWEMGVWSTSTFDERSSTADANLRLVQDSPGHYTYTFLEKITDAITNDGADAALPQQVALRIVDFENYDNVNIIYPLTGLPTTDGEVATEATDPVGYSVPTSACESCHGPAMNGVGHDGQYTRVEFCSNCHTPAHAARTAKGLDFQTMIHQIHAAIDHTEGGTVAGRNNTYVEFPQNVANCRRCHQGAGNDAWTELKIDACDSCHTGIDFSSPTTTHTGGQAAETACAGCHDQPSIIAYHASITSTPNNPEVPAPLVSFEYVINKVTVDENTGNATVNFSILKDGVAITDLHTTYPPAGFTSGPSFLLAYAMPQSGIDQPADWNNKGRDNGEPRSVGLNTLTLSLVGTDTYDAVINTAFPVGAKMRAVGMQGRFKQMKCTAPNTPAGCFATLDADTNLPTPSVVKAVDGDTERRQIINYAGCMDCHEILEPHGGFRVLAGDAQGANICLMCHNPNRSSSGPTFDMSTYTQGSQPGTEDAIARWGNDPLAWPEESVNFKELIHGLHSKYIRAEPYDFPAKSGQVPTIAVVEGDRTFPADASACQKCHLGNSYAPDQVPANALPTVVLTTNGTRATFQDSVNARKGASLPNDADHVHGAVVAACVSCHNSAAAVGHINANGGMLGGARSDVTVMEPDGQCLLCHAPGRIADVNLVHPGLME